MTDFSPAVYEAIERTRSAASVSGIALAASFGADAVLTTFTGGDERGAALGPDSLSIVASITKLATALAIARLVDQGLLSYDDALFDHLPEAACALHGVGLREIMSHCAGLPADLDPSLAPYEPGLDWARLREACLQTPLATTPRSVVQYGNVGYGLLGIIIERITGMEIGEALQTLVFKPLGVEGYLSAELPRPPVYLGDVRGRHTGTDLEPFNSGFYRSLALPWAGLVTTLQGMFRIIHAWAGYPADFLRDATRRDATSNQVGDLGGGLARPLWWSWCPWGLGPELHGAKTPHWVPTHAAPASFGHAGASGCLAWSDPEAGVTWALLGTRTADNGWLIRYGSQIGTALLDMATSEPREHP